MKRYLDYVWPILGLVAVVMSVKLLYEKLKSEAASDLAVKALLETGGLWDHIKVIASVIGAKLADGTSATMSTRPVNSVIAQAAPTP